MGAPPSRSIMAMARNDMELIKRNAPNITHKGLNQVDELDEAAKDFWKKNEQEAYDRKGK